MTSAFPVLLTTAEHALAVLCLPAAATAAVAGVSLRRARRRAAVRERRLRAELSRCQAARAELEQTSCTDPLTGVWNYRYLRQALERERVRHERSAAEALVGAGAAVGAVADAGARLGTAVVLVEVEGLDALRRRHGHHRVGPALRDLAQRLAAEVRRTDVFGRYGGDVFLVLLPDTDRAGAEAVAERLRWTVRRHRLPLPEAPVTPADPVGPADPADPGPADAADAAERGVGGGGRERRGAPGGAPVVTPRQQPGRQQPGGGGAVPSRHGLSARTGIAVMPEDGLHLSHVLMAADSSLSLARETVSGR